MSKILFSFSKKILFIYYKENATILRPIKIYINKSNICKYPQPNSIINKLLQNMIRILSKYADAMSI